MYKWKSFSNFLVKELKLLSLLTLFKKYLIDKLRKVSKKQKGTTILLRVLD